MAKQDNYILLFSSYLGITLVTIFFGMPASIINAIEQEESAAAKTKDDIEHAKKLINSLNSMSAELSNRELEILEKLSQGKTNRQIAEELYLSENTVKNHLYRIYKKIGVNSRTAAIIYYHSYSAKNADSQLHTDDPR
jgi:RNA polymerase sigma factor (sigma-70 family)